MFKAILEKIFGSKKLVKASLYSVFVCRKQEIGEITKKYVEEMHDLQEKAGIEDDVAIITIKANITDKQKANYVFHLKNNMNFTLLFDLLEISENNDELYNGSVDNQKEKKLLYRNDK